MGQPDRQLQIAAPADDLSLLRLLHDDPGEAAAALYDRYGRVVFAAAMRIVGDRGAAEEITQDVFVGCWRAAARYRPEQGSLLTWLLGIAHNRAIDELRSRRHKARAREATFDDYPAAGGIQAQNLDLHLLQAEVRDALAGLPVAQREVIELLYFGGFTRRQAAEKLHAPLGTVHTRLRLGLARLRNALGHLLSDDADPGEP